MGRLTPAGDLTLFELPDPTSLPFGIARGQDGALWFTERTGNRIGRLTTAGELTEFPLRAAGSSPTEITAGPDGALWFTERDGNRIGRITTAGVVTEFPVPTPASGLEGITLGPDGNMWFTEQEARRVGRIEVAGQPAVESRILPVVGSTAGVGRSFFRTSLQLHNRSGSTASGRIVFHRSGISGSSGDPELHYTIGANQTQSLADLLPAMGRSGIGSATVEATSGAIPFVTARVFNDAGSAGTTGFTEDLMRADEALRPGASGVLLLPADLTRFRFNLGVRTLEAGVAATLTLRDAAGGVVGTVSRAFAATYHEQQSAAAFLSVTALPAGGSVTVAVTSGSAIFYGATVDNTTGDPSLQIARASP